MSMKVTITILILIMVVLIGIIVKLLYRLETKKPIGYLVVEKINEVKIPYLVLNDAKILDNLIDGDTVSLTFRE